MVCENDFPRYSAEIRLKIVVFVLFFFASCFRKRTTIANKNYDRPFKFLVCDSLCSFSSCQEMKRLEKARKKAEAICDTVDVSEKEKMNQIKR